MSKKPYKSQASSSRAFASAFGAQTGSNNIRGWFGDGPDAFPGSPISYVYEPPDISAISEPNVIVAFKNLQKRDTTTKLKALEELQSHVSSVEAKEGRVEETVVEAWVSFPERHIYLTVYDFSHVTFYLGKAIPPDLHRQRTPGPQACSSRPGPDICFLWQTNRAVHATDHRCLARRAL